MSIEPRVQSPLEKINRRFTKSSWLAFAFIAVGIATFLHLRTGRFPDPDGFYHFRHAAKYIERGPHYGEFPWASSSVLSAFGGDLWYGFHLLLAPLTLVHDGVIGLKVAGVLLLSTLLLLVYWVGKRHAFAIPAVWPLLLVVSAPAALWRWHAIRPHIVTMGLSALLVSLACRGRLWQVALCSFFVSSLHQAFSWMPILVAVTVTLVRLLTDRQLLWKIGVAAVTGVAAAWLLKPNPLSAARLFEIQLFELMTVRSARLPLTFGNEVFRLPNEELFSHFMPFILLWLLSLSLFFLSIFGRKAQLLKEDSTLLWTSAILSVVFFQLSIVSTSRGVDVWLTFGTLFIGAAYSTLVAPRSARVPGEITQRTRVWLSYLAIPLLVFMAWTAVTRTSSAINERAIDAYRTAPAMNWLKHNSPKNSIVYHVNWGMFAELFFWNQHNRFINGLDPIFQYAYSPELYWKTHRLEVRASWAQTSGTPPGSAPVMEDTAVVLKRDFRASYLFVIKAATPELFEHAMHDQRFNLRYDSETTAVFEL